jgi:hypothetical protein
MSTKKSIAEKPHHGPKIQTVGDSIIQGLNDAISWTAGENHDVRVTQIRVPKANARKIRRKPPG